MNLNLKRRNLAWEYFSQNTSPSATDVNWTVASGGAGGTASFGDGKVALACTGAAGYVSIKTVNTFKTKSGQTYVLRYRMPSGLLAANSMDLLFHICDSSVQNGLRLQTVVSSSGIYFALDSFVSASIYGQTLVTTNLASFAGPVDLTVMVTLTTVSSVGLVSAAEVVVWGPPDSVYNSPVKIFSGTLVHQPTFTDAAIVPDFLVSTAASQEADIYDVKVYNQEVSSDFMVESGKIQGAQPAVKAMLNIDRFLTDATADWTVTNYQGVGGNNAVVYPYHGLAVAGSDGAGYLTFDGMSRTTRGSIFDYVPANNVAQTTDPFWNATAIGSPASNAVSYGTASVDIATGSASGSSGEQIITSSTYPIAVGTVLQASINHPLGQATGGEIVQTSFSIENNGGTERIEVYCYTDSTSSRFKLYTTVIGTPTLQTLANNPTTTTAGPWTYNLTMEITGKTGDNVTAINLWVAGPVGSPFAAQTLLFTGNLSTTPNMANAIGLIKNHTNVATVRTAKLYKFNVMTSRYLVCNTIDAGQQIYFIDSSSGLSIGNASVSGSTITLDLLSAATPSVANHYILTDMLFPMSLQFRCLSGGNAFAYSQAMFGLYGGDIFVQHNLSGDRVFRYGITGFATRDALWTSPIYASNFNSLPIVTWWWDYPGSATMGIWVRWAATYAGVSGATWYQVTKNGWFLDYIFADSDTPYFFQAEIRGVMAQGNMQSGPNIDFIRLSTYWDAMRDPLAFTKLDAISATGREIERDLDNVQVQGTSVTMTNELGFWNSKGSVQNQVGQAIQKMYRLPADTAAAAGRYDITFINPL